MDQSLLKVSETLPMLAGHEDIAMLQNISANMEKYPRGMTEYQIKNGVLAFREFPTKDSKYWQCWLEMTTRFGVLVDSQYRYSQMQIDIEELEYQLDHADQWSKFEYKRKELELAHKKMQLEMLKQEALGVVNQIKIFYNVQNKIDLKHKTKEAGEEEFWTKKDMVRQFERIMGMPDNQPRGMLEGVINENVFDKVKLHVDNMLAEQKRKQLGDKIVTIPPVIYKKKEGE